ncbi:tetratricopeptide repeat protein [Desulfoplanes formicivorans]|nr:tetratricopeptide repeat protein [Desulfoplanes formicivorans]
MFKGKPSRTSGSLFPLELGDSLSDRDTLAAIGELSRVVKNNSDSVETYLALGNLYRSQGELERAIQIRQNLIIRPGLDNDFKGRAYLELGKDYKRAGFMDRSLAALEEAQKLCGKDPRIILELVDLAAKTNEFQTAARHCAALKFPQGQAHYLVLHARSLLADTTNQNRDEALKWLNRAIKIYSPSPEAWLEHLLWEYDRRDWKRFSKRLDAGLKNVARELRFVLLEGLIQHGIKTGSPDPQPHVHPEACARALECIEPYTDDLLLYYYGALLHIQAGDTAQAKTWLEKSLFLDPDFWPTRLEVLLLSLPEQSLNPVFSVQLEFFLKRAQQVKRFVCSQCGLKREQIFYVCPRCRSWHSIRFRKSLND